MRTARNARRPRLPIAVVRPLRTCAVVAALLALASGCASRAASPSIGLQRSLYPGLGDLEASEIAAAFDTQVALEPPLSGGIVWLDERASFGPRLSEYSRAGILQGAVAALGQGPFDRISPLPTTTEFQRGSGGPPSIDAIRAAAARFQYDVAFILQTGLAQESGINPFAIGYLDLVTAPLFPGTDITVTAGAELCAVDVRSGVMLGCGIGRGYEEARYLFPLSASSRADEVREDMIERSVAQAAVEILEQISRRGTRRNIAYRSRKR